MGNPISTLLSRISAERKMIQVSSTNVARADVEGNTSKEVKIYSNISGGGLSGVLIGPVTRSVDPALQREVRSTNSSLSYQDTMESYFSYLSHIFGVKGEQNSFVHELSDLSNALNAISANPDPVNKKAAVNKAVALTSQFNDIADQIQNLRTQADQEISTYIESITTDLEEVKTLNGRIATYIQTGQDATTLEDQRDLLVHKIAEKVDIKTSVNSSGRMTVFTSFGLPLLQNESVSSISMTSSNLVTPTTVTNPVLINSVDAGPNLQSGRIKSLLELRDTILPNLQAELDELCRNLRDRMNALHNEGTALSSGNTITGTAGVPGTVGPIVGTASVSGNGTVRIGVLDSNGTLIDYKDIPLIANDTFNNLITTINTTAYALGNPLGTFTASLTANGEFQLTCGAGYRISMGSVAGNPTPQLNAGAAFAPGSAYGFSHFFGLNNLFVTGQSLASNAFQSGLANIIEVNPNIRSNTNLLAIGRLTDQIPPSTTPGGALGINKAELAVEMSDQLKLRNIDFLTAGVLPSTSTNLVDYASRILAVTQTTIDASALELTRLQNIYDDLATRAQQKTGVEPSEELMKILKLAASQAITGKALNLILGMERELFDTLRG